MLNLILPIVCGYITHFVAFELFKSMYEKTEEERDPFQMVFIIHGTLLASYIVVMFVSLFLFLR